jgi:hypothetical protein
VGYGELEGQKWSPGSTQTAALGELNTTNILNNPTGSHNCVAKAAKCKVGSLGSNKRLSLNNNLF